MIKPKITQKILHLQKNNISKAPLIPALKKYSKEMKTRKNPIVILNLHNRHKSLESNSFYDSGIECQLSKISVQFPKLLLANMDRYWFIILLILIHLNTKLKALLLGKRINKLFCLTEIIFTYFIFSDLLLFLTTKTENLHQIRLIWGIFGIKKLKYQVTN